MSMNSISFDGLTKSEFKRWCLVEKVVQLNKKLAKGAIRKNVKTHICRYTGILGLLLARCMKSGMGTWRIQCFLHLAGMYQRGTAYNFHLPLHSNQGDNKLKEFTRCFKGMSLSCFLEEWFSYYEKMRMHRAVRTVPWILWKKVISLSPLVSDAKSPDSIPHRTLVHFHLCRMLRVLKFIWWRQLVCTMFIICIDS